MQRTLRFRQVLVVAGAAALMLATSLTAGASTIGGKYNAADAKLVPSAYKGKTLQVATDATYPPDESMKGTTPALVWFGEAAVKGPLPRLGSC